MKRKVVQIIGGSASTAYALDEGQLPWPELIAERYPQLTIKHIPKGGMTLVQSIEFIYQIEKCDLLILHFGTSLAWPESLLRWSKRLRVSRDYSFYFHQPPKSYSGGIGSRLVKKLRLRIRNGMKYILFCFGLYKPRTSFQEIKDQISIVSKLASIKANNVLWIQHQPIQTNRIFLERSIFYRYYRETINSLAPMVSSNFRVLQLPKTFLRDQNYLLDGVHLTAQGHKELSELIEEKLTGLLAD
jgi:hypothetical protein